jgi:hypothetical protein
MFEGYSHSQVDENTRRFRLIGVRAAIFGVIVVISLTVALISRWSKSSLHEKLAKHHEQTTANFDPAYMQNGTGSNVVYSIGYTFRVNGKTYHNYAESKVQPKYPRGIVYYDPDDPEENELQPIPTEEEYHGTDR